MINVENEIFSMVAGRMRQEFPNIFITGEYVSAPPSFPALSLVEIENEIYRKSQSTDNMENHDIIVYEANAYSNRTSGKKAECKAIMTALDTELLKLGFTRHMMNPIQNINDASIYRMVGRWRAIVDKNKVIYRR